MIHIVFNETDVSLLEQVIHLDPLLEGPVVCINDDYAVGPIANLNTTDGREERKNWWKALLAASPYGTQRADQINDLEVVSTVIRYLEQDPQQECWIWMGQNQHDVSGYYWLLTQLLAFPGRLMVLYMNNLPFLNEKGQLFYPVFLNEIRPSEFLKAKKLARPITTSEFEIDPDEWKKLTEENSPVRWLEGGKKLVSKEITSFDLEIRRLVGGDWQKASRLLAHLQQRIKIKTGDVFLMSRLHSLTSAGVLERKGQMDSPWKDLEFRQPGAFGSKEIANVVE